MGNRNGIAVDYGLDQWRTSVHLQNQTLECLVLPKRHL